MSGSDYPIKPRERLEAILRQDREYIQVDYEVSEQGESRFDRCANRVFLGDRPSMNPRSGHWLWRRIARRVEPWVRRRFPPSTRIFYGPSWWSLTETAIRQIMDLVDQRPELVDWFRLTRSPDEMFFQTLLAMTDRWPFVAYQFIDHPEERQPHQAALHHVDWETPNPTLPKVLDDGDFDQLITSNALFARKFDESRSSVLRQRLDSCHGPERLSTETTVSMHAALRRDRSAP